MRRTQKFGGAADKTDKTDFEWPKLEDLAKMQVDKPIKVSSIGYKTRINVINQIQVHLSNGSSSIVFQGPKSDKLSELKTLVLNDSAEIRKIKGAKEGYVLM